MGSPRNIIPKLTIQSRVRERNRERKIERKREESSREGERNAEKEREARLGLAKPKTSTNGGGDECRR